MDSMRTWFITQKRRAKEGLMQAVGAHQGTEDTEFDVRSRNFVEHVNQLQRIKDAMELWLDSFDSFCAAGVILSDAFRAHSNCTEDGANNAFENVSTTFSKMNLDIYNTVRPPLRDVFVNRCIKPINSILSLAPAIFEDIQTRKNILLDFDSYRTKIQKEIASGKDLNHPNITKINNKLEDTSKALAVVQSRIAHAFDEFESAKPTMLSQEFAALIACCYHQSSVSRSLYDCLLPFLPQCASSLCLMTLSIPPLSAFDSIQSIYQMQTESSKGLAGKSTVNPVLTRELVQGGGLGGYGEYGLPSVLPDFDNLSSSSSTAASTYSTPSSSSKSMYDFESHHEPDDYPEENAQTQTQPQSLSRIPTPQHQLLAPSSSTASSSSSSSSPSLSQRAIHHHIQNPPPPPPPPPPPLTSSSSSPLPHGVPEEDEVYPPTPTPNTRPPRPHSIRPPPSIYSSFASHPSHAPTPIHSTSKPPPPPHPPTQIPTVPFSDPTVSPSPPSSPSSSSPPSPPCSPPPSPPPSPPSSPLASSTSPLKKNNSSFVPFSFSSSSSTTTFEGGGEGGGVGGDHQDLQPPLNPPPPPPPPPPPRPQKSTQGKGTDSHPTKPQLNDDGSSTEETFTLEANPAPTFMDGVFL